MVFWKLISNYGKSEINIKIILKNFDSIFAQINESNTNRWSNFIFGKMDLYMRTLSVYIAINLSSLLLFIVHISSTIYFEANKSYKFL